MSSDKDFFEEDAFGEMYAGTFFAEDFPKREPENSNVSQREAAEISAATARVRMTNEVDAGQEVNKAINSAYNLGGQLNGGMAPNFGGQIFGGI